MVATWLNRSIRKASLSRTRFFSGEGRAGGLAFPRAFELEPPWDALATRSASPCVIESSFSARGEDAVGVAAAVRSRGRSGGCTLEEEEEEEFAEEKVAYRLGDGAGEGGLCLLLPCLTGEGEAGIPRRSHSFCSAMLLPK